MNKIDGLSYILLKFFSSLMLLDIVACFMGGGIIFSTIGVVMDVNLNDVLANITFVEKNEAALTAIGIAKQLVIIKLIFDIHKFGCGDVGEPIASIKSPFFQKLKNKKKLGQVTRL